jgi:DNA polymerase III delta prime subunit
MNNTLTEKYRPKSFNEIVGNQESIQQIQNLSKRPIGQVPVILLLGPAGCGKTSAAKCFASERKNWLEQEEQALIVSNTDVKEFNASSYRGIDFIREIQQYMGYRTETIIYLNEADNMTDDAKKALRSLLENKVNVIFILDGNDEKGFTEPIKSRCTIFEFQPLSVSEIYNQLIFILKTEGIAVTEEIEKTVNDLAEKSNGDMRQAINSLDQLIMQDKQIVSQPKTNSLEKGAKTLLEESGFNDYTKHFFKLLHIDEAEVWKGDKTSNRIKTKPIIILGTTNIGKTTLSKNIMNRIEKTYEKYGVCNVYTNEVGLGDFIEHGLHTYRYMGENWKTSMPTVYVLVFDDATAVEITPDEIRKFFSIRHKAQEYTGITEGIIYSIFLTHDWYSLNKLFRRYGEAAIFLSIPPLDKFSRQNIESLIGSKAANVLDKISSKAMDYDEYPLLFQSYLGC